MRKDYPDFIEVCLGDTGETLPVGSDGVVYRQSSLFSDTNIVCIKLRRAALPRGHPSELEWFYTLVDIQPHLIRAHGDLSVPEISKLLDEAMYRLFAYVASPRILKARAESIKDSISRASPGRTK